MRRFEIDPGRILNYILTQAPEWAAGPAGALILAYERGVLEGLMWLVFAPIALDMVKRAQSASGRGAGGRQQPDAQDGPQPRRAIAVLPDWRGGRE